MSGLRERLNRFKKNVVDLKGGHPDSDGLAAESAGTYPKDTSGRTGESGAIADAAGGSDSDVRSSRDAARVSLGPEWDRLDAELVTNDWGSFIRRTRRYDLEHVHGRYPLGAIREQASALSAFHPDLPVEPESLLFFDTETTGLGQGAGNVPFMLGIGYYTDDAFVVEQLFIRNPAEEIAMLAYFCETAERFTHLVSYNGRTFDWPVMQNRCVINRLDFELPKPEHLDFLHPSRGLWKYTMPSCRLSMVEEEQLAFRRTDDVPGSMAPVLYFRYLAEGDPEVLTGVFIHNELDIVSLAGLAIHFGCALNGQLIPHLMEAEEVFRFGLWLDKMQRCRLAEEAFDHLLNRSPQESGDYWVPLAAFYKKKKMEKKAVSLWLMAANRLAEGDIQLGEPEPFVELAMYHEHKRKDCAAALGFAEEALRQHLKRCSFTRPSAKQKEQTEALKKRIHRLRKKADIGKKEAPRRKVSSDDMGTLF